MAFFPKAPITSTLADPEILEAFLDEARTIGWHVILSKSHEEDFPYDALILKTFKKMVNQYVMPGHPNPLHQDKEELVQIVLAITVDSQGKKDPEKLSHYTKGWTFKHFFIKSLPAALRELKNITQLHDK